MCNSPGFCVRILHVRKSKAVSVWDPETSAFARRNKLILEKSHKTWHGVSISIILQDIIMCVESFCDKHVWCTLLIGSFRCMWHVHVQSRCWIEVCFHLTYLDGLLLHCVAHHHRMESRDGCKLIHLFFYLFQVDVKHFVSHINQRNVLCRWKRYR